MFHDSCFMYNECMQFQVPQFIDIEDKIFGPFTFKQFIYLVGGAGLCFILYKLLPFLIAVPIMLAVAAFSLALTFYKINNKPFIFIVQAWLGYALQNKLYIWKRGKKKKAEAKGEEPETESLVPRLSDSKLKDLAWSLDVLDVNKK